MATSGRSRRSLKSTGSAAPLDERLVRAARAQLAEDGWEALTLERVAQRAGISRVTAWRQGATRDLLIRELLDRLGSDFRDALWPVLASSGSGAERLSLGLERLCDVVDGHLPLLVATPQAFHWEFRGRFGAAAVNFVEPFARFLADGAADGSLRRFDEDAGETAEVAFNTVCWTYLHLRAAHDLAPVRARGRVLDVVMHGLAAGPGAASPSVPAAGT